MGLLNESWFMHVMLDYSMDVDMSPLVQTSPAVHHKIAEQWQIRFASCTGTLTCCHHGISGLWHFYQLHQLGECLRMLSPMIVHLQHGKIAMCKDEGFARSMQTMTCAECNESAESTWKRVCGCFGKQPDLSELQRRHKKGIEVSLPTLADMMERLQGDIVIRDQRHFAMWHNIYDRINDCVIVVDGSSDPDARPVGPALYHQFQFDLEEVDGIFSNPVDDEGVRRFCFSDPVSVHHEKYGDCLVTIQLEVEEGFIFMVKLHSTTTGDDIDLVGHYIPNRDRHDVQEIGIRPKCEMVVISPSTFEWALLDQDMYYFTDDGDDTGVQHELCWLSGRWGVYLPVKEALQSGRPLPIFVSMVE